LLAQNRESVIGTLLNDRFRLEERIGSGGMSTVYLAFDETLERWVAIKLLHSEISADEDQIERFRREARAVARLSHPHVVTVIDFGEDQGHPYIVFEYVDGETLKERIRRVGRLEVPEAVAYAIEIGRALQAAHAERLVHRDVKPQNVLIDGEGRAKVTDFGIARSLEAEGLTATGRVLGTTDYVSPEQALGEGVSQQSDIYSLGIVLYEMLTGDVPFKGETQVSVAMKHVREPLPDIQRRRPDVSAALASVVERATAKEQRNRYASTAEMIDDLEHALAIEAARAGHTSGEATTVLRELPPDTVEGLPRRLRNPRAVLVLSLLAAAIAAVLIVVLASRTEQGTTGGAAPKRSGGLHAVTLRSGATDDYDPPPGGDGSEHSDEVHNVIDEAPATQWTTEQYQGGQGRLGQKPGVGLRIDTGSAGVAARRLDLISSKPGWQGVIYAANDLPESIQGWTKVSQPFTAGERTRVPLDSARQKFSNYLIWIIKVPPEGRAAISELTLYR
jgi:eukaryotic-like serine/threonine-protein kinase